MIIQTVDIHQFRQGFVDYDRNNFSYEGLSALFDMLEEYSGSGGTPLELDIIGLCCDYTEYSDFEEIQKCYSCTQLDDIEDLHDHTIVVEFEGGIIIQNF